MNKSSQCCIYCGKTYKKKINLDKHLIVCELINKKTKVEYLEDDNLPSQRKLYEMLIELGQKYKNLEEKVEEMNKYIVKKKKKINLIEWLNTNVNPNMIFDNLINAIIITENDIKYFLENLFIDLLDEIFQRTIYNMNESDRPIFALSHKQNILYIYNSNNCWSEMTNEQLFKFLNKIHINVINEFYVWKKSQRDLILKDDSYAIKCDRATVKLMDIDLKRDIMITKIKNLIFSKIKTDIKAFVEYEFEV